MMGEERRVKKQASGRNEPEPGAEPRRPIGPKKKKKRLPQKKKSRQERKKARKKKRPPKAAGRRQTASKKKKKKIITENHWRKYEVLAQNRPTPSAQAMPREISTPCGPRWVEKSHYLTIRNNANGFGIE